MIDQKKRKQAYLCDPRESDLMAIQALVVETGGFEADEDIRMGILILVLPEGNGKAELLLRER